MYILFWNDLVSISFSFHLAMGTVELCASSAVFSMVKGHGFFPLSANKAEL